LIDRVLSGAARKIVHAAWEAILPENEGPVLELLSGPQGMMPEGRGTDRVVGTAVNLEELEQNRSLTHRVVVDVNRTPSLPFSPEAFSAAVLVFGVEMLEDPGEIFTEAARVLKPGAPFLVVFSSETDEDYSFPGWRFMDEHKRLSYVSSVFERTESFGRITAYGTRKRYRSEASRKKTPAKDRAPVWVVYSQKIQKDRVGEAPWGNLARVAEGAGNPRVCPYCGEGLKKWTVPHSPFEIQNWYETDFLYICFNDECPYFQRGWQWMWARQKRNVSYRHMYNPVTHRTGPMPVPTSYALRDGIVEEER